MKSIAELRLVLVTVFTIISHHTNNCSVNDAVSQQPNSNHQKLLTLHFYELKPYIYYEGNQWKGILADFIGEMVKQDPQCWHDFIEHGGRQYQTTTSQTPPKISAEEYHLTNFVNMTHRYTNRTDFIRHNHQYIKSGKHQNETTLWFPVLGNSELAAQSADSFDVVFGDTLAPVVLRESLDLFSRVNRTMEVLLGPCLFSVLLLVGAAILLRVLVSDNNKSGPKLFSLLSLLSSSSSRQNEIPSKDIKLKI